MKKLILLVVLVFIAGCIGCRIEKTEMAALNVEPTVTEWSPEDTIVVIKEVKKVDGLEMGRVILKRQNRRALFSAMVIPYREIPVETKVKVTEVTYMHGGGNIKNFLVVR